MVPFLQSSLALLAVGGVIAPETMPKHTVQYFLSVVPFVAAYELLRAGRFRQVLIGVSLAIPVHALIGMYQMYTFDRGSLPFLDLMATNPGMAIPIEVSEGYAEFTRRPFGLFAEPSAMAACIGPWLVLIAGLAANPTQSPALRVHRALLGVALLSGCFLLAVSQSGQAPFVLAGIALALLSTLARKDETPARPWRSWAAVALLLGVVVTTAIEYASLFGQAGYEAGAKSTAMEARADSSWERRLNSFLFVWDALSHDVKTFLFGVGPGQAYPLIIGSGRFTGRLQPEITAVWSITGGYVAETGVLGLACIGVITGAMAVSIWKSANRTFGIACAFVWLTGVLLATSYVQQPSLWFFLALLLNWSKQFGLRQISALPGNSTRAWATS
jgi:hypothetical protein